ncbi:MAG: ABC transporter permease [Chloroflexi bacterium]|nr:ABC transporter permease [Chloroflexota bacterium]
MGRFIARRLLASVPVLFLVVTLVFFAFQLIPGDAARMYVGGYATEEAVEAARHELGLDQPVLVQYANYLQGIARGDLGKSVQTRRPVSQEILPSFVNTVELSVAAIILASALGVTLGTVAAIKRGTVWDHLMTIVALFGISVPVFWLGLMMAYYFSVTLHVLPSAGKATWQAFVMPTVCLSAFSVAFITRMTRSSLLEVMGQDFIRTARAKGLRESAVVGWHALRNALLPIVTVIGLRFGYMLGGAVVTEQVFAWPGLGRLLVTAVTQRDIPMIQGALLIFGASFVLVNLAVDVLYTFLDPRVRYR